MSMIWFTMDFLRGMKCECLRLLTAGLSWGRAPVVAASDTSSSWTAKVNGVAQFMFDEMLMMGDQLGLNTGLTARLRKARCKT